MKWSNAITFFAIASFAMAGHSYAQSNGVQATIPFDFTVSGKLLPAGTYTIKPVSGPHTIVIKNQDKPIAAVSLVDQDGKRSSGGGRLLFHRYGTQYFLSEILCDAANMDLKVPTSKGEKQVQLDEARLRTAGQTMVATR